MSGYGALRKIKIRFAVGGEKTFIADKVRLKVVTKKAVPAGMRMNPFTKEMQMMKAKPARKVVKAQALKALKDTVA